MMEWCRLQWPLSMEHEAAAGSGRGSGGKSSLRLQAFLLAAGVRHGGLLPNAWLEMLDFLHDPRWRWAKENAHCEIGALGSGEVRRLRWIRHLNPESQNPKLQP